MSLEGPIVKVHMEIDYAKASANLAFAMYLFRHRLYVHWLTNAIFKGHFLFKLQPGQVGILDGLTWVKPLWSRGIFDNKLKEND